LGKKEIRRTGEAKVKGKIKKTDKWPQPFEAGSTFDVSISNKKRVGPISLQPNRKLSGLVL